MRRFSSFRDFDWVLLSFVLVLSVISVLEIKSATLQTTFRGFETKQVESLIVGVGTNLAGSRQSSFILSDGVVSGAMWRSEHDASSWVEER